MPVWVLSLLGGVLSIVGSLVGRVLLSLGVGFVAFNGVQSLMSSMKAQVISQFSGLPSTIVGILAVTKVDVAISIVFSAIAARLVINGLQSDVIKKLVFK